MSYADDLNDMVYNFGTYASETDVLAWNDLDLGTTMNDLTTNHDLQWVSFGGFGIDLFASEADDGIYYTCFYAYYYNDYDYSCDYYRIAALYDGWSTGAYMPVVDGYDWKDNTSSNYFPDFDMYFCNTVSGWCADLYVNQASGSSADYYYLGFYTYYLTWSSYTDVDTYTIGHDRQDNYNCWLTC